MFENILILDIYFSYKQESNHVCCRLIGNVFYLHLIKSRGVISFRQEPNNDSSVFVKWSDIKIQLYQVATICEIKLLFFFLPDGLGEENYFNVLDWELTGEA